jgi:hypothetical protein
MAKSQHNLFLKDQGPNELTCPKIICIIALLWQNCHNTDNVKLNFLQSQKQMILSTFGKKISLI